MPPLSQFTDSVYWVGYSGLAIVRDMFSHHCCELFTFATELLGIWWEWIQVIMLACGTTSPVLVESMGTKSVTPLYGLYNLQRLACFHVMISLLF